MAKIISLKKAEDEYHSTDPGNGGREIDLPSGDEEPVVVSDDKAAQLEADFPGRFKIEGWSGGSRKTGSAPRKTTARKRKTTER